jgi:N-acyl-D-amino-acid deacylase
MPFLKFFTFVSFFLLAAIAARGAETYDILIRGGKLLDGTGAPWRYADVAVKGDRIVAVGTVAADATAKTVVDAKGLYVAPGYIDPHSHASDALEKADRAGVRALIAQGITTAVINPDGGGPAELAPQLKLINQAKPGVNVVPLIGHNTARITAMAYEERDPKPEDTERMREVIRKGMEAGAWGMSDGLFYSPANKSKTEEVIDLAKIAAQFNGFYTAHVRDDSDYNIGAVGAVDEVIRVAREGKLPGIVTHIKTMGPRGKGLSKQMIDHIQAARAEGVEVWADQYPYLASSSSMSAYLIPEWAQTGGTGAILSRLGNTEVMKGIDENLVRRGGAELMQITTYAPNRSYEGKRLSEIAKEMGKDPTEAAIQLLKDSGGRVPVVSHTVNESDSDALMAQAWTMTCTDGGAPVFGQGAVNPRAYGTYPYKITRDVLERKVITLEQAVHVGTGLPAAVHGLKDRGVIRENAFADIQVFDLTKLKATATFEKPHAYAEGMVFVFVNGEAAVANGEFKDARGGKILLRTDKTVSER